MFVFVQLNEALCASSPNLASPCEYQSPVDSMNTLTVPLKSPRPRSMGVSNSESNLDKHVQYVTKVSTPLTLCKFFIVSFHGTPLKIWQQIKLLYKLYTD